MPRDNIMVNDDSLNFNKNEIAFQMSFTFYAC